MASVSGFEFDRVIQRALNREPLARKEILLLLRTRNPSRLKALFGAARTMRERFFQNAVFLYGFVYLSTYCRNNCRFCLYRRENTGMSRYRKSEDEILRIANGLAASGVHLIDLTLGEDPFYFVDDYAPLGHIVSAVKAETGLPVMVSPGVLSEDGYAALKAAGADWYACYQETHSRGLFRRLRPGQDFDEREGSRRAAREHGLLTEDGILSGVGETPEDVLRSLEHFRVSGAEQVRVMGFVPDGPIPMGPRPEAASEAVIIALMRLLFPDRLIPASLDVEGLEGLSRRLEAGANVVTSIIPPGEGLQGVARSALDIEEGNRTVPRVLEVVEKQGLQPGTPEEYREVMADSRTGRACVST